MVRSHAPRPPAPGPTTQSHAEQPEKCEAVRATRRWRPCWTRISSTKPRVSRVVKPIGTNRSPNELRQRELAEERELTRLQQWVYVGLGLSVAHWVQPPAGSLRLALLSEALSFPSRAQS